MINEARETNDIYRMKHYSRKKTSAVSDRD